MKLRLKDLREDKDKTQQDLADYLSCKQQTYSRYENGVAQPSIEILEKLAVYFNTSIDYIVGFTDDARPYKHSKSKES